MGATNMGVGSHMLIGLGIWESSVNGIIIVGTGVVVVIVDSEGVGVVVMVVNSAIVWIRIGSVT